MPRIQSIKELTESQEDANPYRNINQEAISPQPWLRNVPEEPGIAPIGEPGEYIFLRKRNFFVCRNEDCFPLHEYANYSMACTEVGTFFPNGDYGDSENDDYGERELSCPNCGYELNEAETEARYEIYEQGRVSPRYLDQSLNRSVERLSQEEINERRNILGRWEAAEFCYKIRKELLDENQSDKKEGKKKKDTPKAPPVHINPKSPLAVRCERLNMASIREILMTTCNKCGFQTEIEKEEKGLFCSYCGEEIDINSGQEIEFY